MAHSAYPTGIELAEFLFDSKVIDSFPVDYTLYDQAAATAKATWEKETRWPIFLGESEDSTTEFRDWDQDFLDFNGGYVSITSVAFDGIAMSENTDYRVFPANRSPKRFMLMGRNPGQVVTIVGKQGYSATLPDDVYRAVLCYGGSLVWSQHNQNGVLQSVKQGDVSYTYQQSTAQNPTNQFSQWQELFYQTCDLYRRGLAG